MGLGQYLNEKNPYQLDTIGFQPPSQPIDYNSFQQQGGQHYNGYGTGNPSAMDTYGQSYRNYMMSQGYIWSDQKNSWILPGLSPGFHGNTNDPNKIMKPYNPNQYINNGGGSSNGLTQAYSEPSTGGLGQYLSQGYNNMGILNSLGYGGY